MSVLLTTVGGVLLTVAVTVDPAFASARGIRSLQTPRESVPPKPVAYRCGEETFEVAFDDARALVIMRDRSRVTLARQKGATDSAGRQTFSNGRLTFVQETDGKPRVLFARGRRALMPCASEAGGEWIELKPANPGSGAVFRLTGTVHRLEIEGGQFVIRAADGKQYSPMNLPAELRTDGTRVEVEARQRDDMMSIGMTGPLIEIVRIRKVPDRE